MSSSCLGFDISLAGRVPAKCVQAMRACNSCEGKMLVPQKAPSKPSVRREFVSV
jgi:hypothetical protein